MATEPTALIHEARLRLGSQTSVHAEDRVHFYGICLNEEVAGAPARGRDVDALHLTGSP